MNSAVPDHPSPPQGRTVTALGLAQMISWGSYFYAFALLLPDLTARLQAGHSAVVGAYSLALLTTGLCAAPVGAWMDRHGGRGLMSGASLVGGVLLALMSQVHAVWQLYLLWAGIGAVMAATLYDPAFTVLTQLFRENARRAITMLTLFGGLASTVFWPLTQWLQQAWGWQGALLVLATLNLFVAAPLQAWAIPRRTPAANVPTHQTPSTRAPALRELLRQRTFLCLAAAFTLNMLVFTALTVHLISLLQVKGLTAAQAAWVGACIGPMQVLGRLFEYGFLGNIKPSRLGRFVMALMPAAMGCLLLAQGLSAAMVAFVVLYGLGNGLISILRGTLPLELYGAARYGIINGAMATPVLMARALGPIAMALALDAFSTQAVLGLLLLGACASLFMYLLALPPRDVPAAP